MENIDKLKAVIDELKLESRKLEYSSALERLTRRVDSIEEKLEIIINYIKCQKERNN